MVKYEAIINQSFEGIAITRAVAMGGLGNTYRPTCPIRLVTVYPTVFSKIILIKLSGKRQKCDDHWSPKTKVWYF
jgi:hypothetical protein